MRARFLTCVLVLLAGAAGAAGPTPVGDIEEAPHHYWALPDDDPFTRFIKQVNSGGARLPEDGDEKKFLVELLAHLDIPVSSQLWVYSGTSMQSGRITPRNPRAVYFNEDVYVGYVPGGQMEIASVDPDRGPIFYIFDLPKPDRPVRFLRSDRCMNCHAGDAQLGVPGLAIESVIPGPNTGSLDAFRRGETGHGIPLEQRFGGWHVTGVPDGMRHHGNMTGELSAGKMTLHPLPPGSAFDVARFPVATSDVLAHLILEHQTGFTNRVIKARYFTRAALAAGGGRLGAEDAREMDAMAAELTRYILFADEAELPREGLVGDSAYRAAFAAGRKAAPDGRSLRDLDLRTRLFKYRCSYLIHTRLFTTLPKVLKDRVHARLSAALSTTNAAPEFDYLPAAEKVAIREIVAATQRP